MEQGLYAQVVMIRRKDLDHKKEKDKAKQYNLPGQSARSIRWFNLDHEWLVETFRTHEQDFYLKSYQKNIKGQETKRHQFFLVSIGNAKIQKNRGSPKGNSAKI